MGSKGCMQCLRWFLFILNLLFWLAGMGVLGVALWLRLDPEVSDYMKLHEKMENFYTGVYLLIAIGVFMTLFGFLGCCGALRKSQCMLVSFFILLVVIFIAELACAVVAYFHQDEIKKYVENSMLDTVHHHYHAKPYYTEIFDQIQRRFKCCGVRSYKDWLDSFYVREISGNVELGVGATSYGRVPESCCNDAGRSNYPEDCGTGFTKNQLYSYEAFLHNRGCRDAIYNKFYDNLNIVIGLAIGIGAIQLVGMVLTMGFCCMVNLQKEQDRKTGRYE